MQEAAITALEGGDGDKLAEYCAIYRERRDHVVTALRDLGLECEPPRATFYIWARVPRGYTSKSLTERVLKEAGVVITPGSGFGSKGEGYFRISAFNSRANAEEVSRRLQELKW